MGMKRAIAFLVVVSLAWVGVIYLGNGESSTAAHTNWPGSNNVGTEPAAVPQAFRWVANPGQASCHNLSYCTVYFTPTAINNVLMTAYIYGPNAGASQACTGWYNESSLTNVGWACLWLFAYDSGFAYSVMGSQRNNGIVYAWWDSPGLPFAWWF